MFHFIYLIQSEKDSSLYVGYTNNINRRLKEHNNGINFSTKHSKPWKIIFFEGYLNEKDAKRREKYLKTSQGIRIIKRMVKEYLYENKSKKQ